MKLPQKRAESRIQHSSVKANCFRGRCYSEGMGDGIDSGNWRIGFRCAGTDCSPFQVLPLRPGLLPNSLKLAGSFSTLQWPPARADSRSGLDSEWTPAWHSTHQESATRPIMNCARLSIKLAASVVAALSIMLAGSAKGQSGRPPSITTQPTGKTVPAHTTATFGVKVDRKSTRLNSSH